MPPEATIAISCGELQDGFIAFGVQDIQNYAEWLRENDPDRPWPLVWNLSLGSNQGPHDKRTSLNQVLDIFGQKGIVCVSAGNEGDLKIALKKTFTEEERTTWGSDIKAALKALEKRAMRAMILETGERVDGRTPEEIRPLYIVPGYLPRVHGSGLARLQGCEKHGRCRREHRHILLQLRRIQSHRQRHCGRQHFLPRL